MPQLKRLDAVTARSPVCQTARSAMKTDSSAGTEGWCSSRLYLKQKCSWLTPSNVYLMVAELPGVQGLTHQTEVHFISCTNIFPCVGHLHKEPVVQFSTNRNSSAGIILSLSLLYICVFVCVCVYIRSVRIYMYMCAYMYMETESGMYYMCVYVYICVCMFYIYETHS